MEPEERHTPQNDKHKDRVELLKHLKELGEGKVNLRAVFITVLATALLTATATMLLEFNAVKQRITHLESIVIENRDRIKTNEKSNIQQETTFEDFEPCIRSLCIRPDFNDGLDSTR